MIDLKDALAGLFHFLFEIFSFLRDDLRVHFLHHSLDFAGFVDGTRLAQLQR